MNDENRDNTGVDHDSEAQITNFNERCQVLEGINFPN